MGLDRGRMIRQKMAIREAPSMAAASSSSRGMPLKKPGAGNLGRYAERDVDQHEAHVGVEQPQTQQGLEHRDDGDLDRHHRAEDEQQEQRPPEAELVSREQERGQRRHEDAQGHLHERHDKAVEPVLGEVRHLQRHREVVPVGVHRRRVRGRGVELLGLLEGRERHEHNGAIRCSPAARAGHSR